MNDTERPVGRALPRDLADNAPSPPRVQKWNRRIVGWGLAPLLVTGLIGGLLPNQGQAASVLGALFVILVTVPVTARAWHLKRRNQSLYRTAADVARGRGHIVRVVETDAGDFEYLVAEPAIVERFAWPHEPDAAATMPPPSGSPSEPCAVTSPHVVSPRNSTTLERRDDAQGG